MTINLWVFPFFILALVNLGSVFLYALSKINYAFNKHSNIDNSLISEYGIIGVGLGIRGVLGSFFLGMIAVVFDFSLPLSSPFFLLIILLLVVLGFFLTFKALKKIKKHELYTFIVITLLLSLWIGTLQQGVDGGLYHLPHQLWLRNEPIVIGLANFHGRFGFSSLYEYINASLWIHDNLIWFLTS